MPQSTSTPHPQPSPAAEPWPEGVIARYLTVGGATVDLTRTRDPQDEDACEWDETRAACTGCTNASVERWDTRPYIQLISTEHAEQRATQLTRAWAQAHAEKCRALPSPEAAR